MNLKDLNIKIVDCKKCRLFKDAQNAVPGEGPENAKLMLVGQNPGAQEDEVGKPFIGRAGKFLDKVLEKNGFSHKDLFITNIVKHVTPENRKPQEDEICACLPYLTEQIERIKPKIIVLMGNVAKEAPRKDGIIYVETVHPSAAMRFTKMRKRFEKDFSDLKDCIQHG